MHPICFEIGKITVYWYGVFCALGFLAAIVHWTWLGRKEDKPDDYASTLAFYMMLSGICGARIAYVIANWSHFAAHPVEIIRLDQGGLIFYGGLIGGILGAMAVAWKHKEALKPFGDFIITALPLGHALGRVGCFMNGCCYGSECHLPWSVSLNHVSRHPVQLYEAGLNLLLYLFLTKVYRRPHKPGTVLALYLLCYPPIRFMLEFIRGDERMMEGALTMAQCISLGLFLAGAIFMVQIYFSESSRA